MNFNEKIDNYFNWIGNWNKYRFIKIKKKLTRQTILFKMCMHLHLILSTEKFSAIMFVAGGEQGGDAGDITTGAGVSMFILDDRFLRRNDEYSTSIGLDKLPSLANDLPLFFSETIKLISNIRLSIFFFYKLLLRKKIF